MDKHGCIRLLISLLVLMAAICAQWKSCKGDDDEEKNSKIIYKDAGQPVEARVEDLLSRMTVAEKIGQMTQIERAVASPDVIEKFGIGAFMDSYSPFV
jgi:hypothetical protein